MKIYKEIEPNLFKDGSSVALGFFDGVHIGHQEIINSAIRFSKQNNIPSVVATFSNHPHTEITGQSPKQLTLFEDRMNLISNLSVDAVLALDFNHRLRHMSAQDYFTKVLIECLNAKYVSIGYDHKFGFNQEGNPDKLREWGKNFGLETHITPPVNINDEPISSTRIRKSISAGKVTSASQLLSRNYSLTGLITQGLQRGSQLGFPTANLMIPSTLIIPANGVYVGLASLNETKEKLPCVVNIGYCPTFKDSIDVVKVETHILNFKYKELYKQTLKVEFIKRLRDEMKFASKEDLVSQIKKDCDQAKELLQNNL